MLDHGGIQNVPYIQSPPPQDIPDPETRTWPELKCMGQTAVSVSPSHWAIQRMCTHLASMPDPLSYYCADSPEAWDNGQPGWIPHRRDPSGHPGGPLNFSGKGLLGHSSRCLQGFLSGNPPRFPGGGLPSFPGSSFTSFLGNGPLVTL